MKTLVISDTHLDLPFDQKKYDFLHQLFESVDRIIINGDFWEGYHLSFDQFLTSPWNGLFPLLKEKQTVYIFGNHDQQKFSDARTSAFSVKQTSHYECRIDGQQYVFEHGNRLIRMIDEKTDRREVGMILQAIMTPLQKFIVSTFGAGIMGKYYQKLNEQIKEKLPSPKTTTSIFFFGHTHVFEQDHKERFYNSGFVNFGVAQYYIIENNQITPFHIEYS